MHRYAQTRQPTVVDAHRRRGRSSAAALTAAIAPPPSAAVDMVEQKLLTASFYIIVCASVMLYVCLWRQFSSNDNRARGEMRAANHNCRSTISKTTSFGAILKHTTSHQFWRHNLKGAQVYAPATDRYISYHISCFLQIHFQRSV